MLIYQCGKLFEIYNTNNDVLSSLSSLCTSRFEHARETVGVVSNCIMGLFGEPIDHVRYIKILT